MAQITILPSDEEDKMKTCSVEPCENKAQGNGFCYKHGGRKSRCIVDGCMTLSRAGKLFCLKHANQCVVKGCIRKANGRRFCNQHSNTICSADGCHGLELAGGFCVDHGGQQFLCTFQDCGMIKLKDSDVCRHHHESSHRRCTKEGCIKWIRRQGLCDEHFVMQHNQHSDTCESDYSLGLEQPASDYEPPPENPKKRGKICYLDGCTTKAQLKGLCFKHGSQIIQRCSLSGCFNVAHSEGLCRKHSKKVTELNDTAKCQTDGCVTALNDTAKCQSDGCKNKQYRRGLCQRHARKNVYCKMETCTKAPYRTGLCRIHFLQNSTPPDFVTEVKIQLSESPIITNIDTLLFDDDAPLRPRKNDLRFNL
jgi:hypothetical protein